MSGMFTVVISATIVRMPKRQSQTHAIRQHIQLLVCAGHRPCRSIFRTLLLFWLKIPNAQLDCIENRLRHRLLPMIQQQREIRNPDGLLIASSICIAQAFSYAVLSQGTQYQTRSAKSQATSGEWQRISVVGRT